MRSVITEVWGFDPISGQAILRQGTSWLQTSLENAWEPQALTSEEDALRWALASSWAIPVGRQYPDQIEAISDVREAAECALPGLRNSLTTPLRPGVPEGKTSESGHRSRVSSLVGHAMARPGSARRMSLFPDLLADNSSRLERLLDRLGCPEDETLEIVTEILKRLFLDPTGWRDEGELNCKFLKLALRAVEERHWSQSRVTTFMRPSVVAPLAGILQSPLDQRIKDRLEASRPESLAALVTWTDLSLDPLGVEIALQMNPGEIDALVRGAAQEVRLPSALLRARLFALPCHRVARELLLRRVPAHREWR